MAFWSATSGDPLLDAADAHGAGGARRSIARVAGITVALFALGVASVSGADKTPASSNGVDRILIVYQDNPTLPAVIDIAEGFSNGLKARMNKPELYPEFLDAMRFKDPGHLERVAQGMARKYAEVAPDVVVTMGPEAFRFVLNNRDRIAPGAPLVFGDISQRSFDRLSPPSDVNGIVTAYDITKTVERAIRLQPDASRIVVISGSGEFDKYWQGSAREALGSQFRNLPIEYVSDLTLDQFADQASSLSEKAILLILTVIEDAAGRRMLPRDAAAIIAEASGAPAYSPISSYIGIGILGGHMATYVSTGEDIAALVASVLANRLSGEVLHANARPVINWREMRRWGMSRDALPGGTNLLFYSPTLWEEYRWQIMLVTIGLAMQTLAILGLLYQRKRRRTAELESQHRLLEVVHLNQSATAGALSASIAHELNQPIGAIRSNAEAAEAILRGAAPDLQLVREILADIRDDDQRASDIIHRFRAMLKWRDQIEWQEFDVNEILDGAFRILHGEAERRRILLTATKAARALRVRADRVHVQQVIVNLATNAMDAVHETAAREKRVDLETTLSAENKVIVTVSDTGKGIPREKLASVFEPFFTTKADGMGLGLSIARAIVETYGGKIWADNGPGSGAVFRFTLPLVQS